MPRPAAVNPTVRIVAYLSPENAAMLNLATFSTEQGKRPFGTTSELVNAALTEYFANNRTRELVGDLVRSMENVQPGN